MEWNNRNSLIIIYKLLHDLLFLMLIFFAVALMADGLIPGIISNHVSFLKITIFSILNLAAVYALGNYLQIKFKDQTKNKKTTILLVAIAALLIFNSLIKLNIFLAIFILLVVLLSGYFIWKNIFEDLSA